MSDTRKPAAKVTFFPISAAIWRDEVNDKVYYRTSISKYYKSAEGGFSSTPTFDPPDLLLVAKVADAAHTEIERLKSEDRRARKSADEDAA
jgi:hypothetical protein